VKPDLSARLRLARSRARARWYAWWYAATDVDGEVALRPRWEVRSALAMCAVAVAGVGLGWWVWWQARPHTVDVDMSVLAPGSPPPGLIPTPVPTTAPSPTPSAPSSLVIDVEGRVRRPGVVLVASGGRVWDALVAAGGARSGVSTRTLNLARPLVDGEQIVLDPDHPAPPPPPKPGPAGSRPEPVRGRAAAAPSAAHPVNLNTATSAELQTLPGVGPVLASRILAWRTAHGRFSTVAELQEVSGIGPARFAVLRPLVRV